MERTFFTTFPFGGGDMFDIGANLGVVSLMLAKNQSSERIFAFEPNPFTFIALVDNIRLNGTSIVKPQRLAVADVDGAIPFVVDPVRRGTASIASGARAADSVVSVTLDSFISNHGIERIGVLKLDVEGYETAVLLGASKMLEHKLASVIYYEVCPEITRRAGFEPLAPTRMLQGYGYEICALKRQRRLESVNPTVEITTVTCENWIGLLPERISSANSWIA